MGSFVEVRDGNIEKALSKFKKKVQNSGLLFDLSKREYYAKPTTQRKIKAAAAKKRWQKYLRSEQLPSKRY